MKKTILTKINKLKEEKSKLENELIELENELLLKERALKIFRLNQRR